MKKPPFISHYLVLNDLIEGVNVREYSDNIVYMTARIENIKNDLVNQGLKFDENAKAKSRYSTYKPYVLIRSEENIRRAKELLERYRTPKVKAFLDAS